MIKFNIDDQSYKLVFKHGTAIAPSIAFLIPGVRRVLREEMSHRITSSTPQTRTKPIHIELKPVEFLEPRVQKLRRYFTTSVFVVNLTTKEIEAGPYTRVCVPPDHFDKELGREEALNMMVREHPVLGGQAIRAYKNRF